MAVAAGIACIYDLYAILGILAMEHAAVDLGIKANAKYIPEEVQCNVNLG